MLKTRNWSKVGRVAQCKGLSHLHISSTASCCLHLSPLFIHSLPLLPPFVHLHSHFTPFSERLLLWDIIWTLFCSGPWIASVLLPKMFPSGLKESMANLWLNIVFRIQKKTKHMELGHDKLILTCTYLQKYIKAKFSLKNAYIYIEEVTLVSVQGSL